MATVSSNRFSAPFSPFSLSRTPIMHMLFSLFVIPQSLIYFHFSFYWVGGVGEGAGGLFCLSNFESPVIELTDSSAWSNWLLSPSSEIFNSVTVILQFQNFSLALLHNYCLCWYCHFVHASFSWFCLVVLSVLSFNWASILMMVILNSLFGISMSPYFRFSFFEI